MRTYIGTANTLAGSTMTFGNTVDGAHNLTIAGNAVFGNRVGNSARLQSVAVSGITALNGLSVATLGEQNYDGAVTLGTANILTASRVNFDETVNGAHALDIVGEAVFDKPPGDSAALQSLTVSGATALNGGAVTTIGDQVYNGRMTLGVGSILTADGSVTLADVTSGGKGSQDLQVSAVGQTTFNGIVSGVGALRSDRGGNTTFNASVDAVSVTLDDTANLNGGDIATSGDQDYNAAVILGVGTTLIADGNVNLASVTGGDNDLQISAAGDTTFHGAVSDVGALITDRGGHTTVNNSISAASVTLDDTATLNAVTVSTSGDQEYRAGVELGASIDPKGGGNLTLLEGNNVTFSSTLNGNANDLTINVEGSTIFMDEVSDVNQIGMTAGTLVDFQRDVAVNQLLISGITDGKGSVLARPDVTFNGTTVTLDLLNIQDGRNIDHNAALLANELQFCVSGTAEFVNLRNAIQNAKDDFKLWQAEGKFVVTDSVSAQFFTGTGKGSGVATDFDEALQRLIATLIPQLQLQLQQAVEGDYEGERLLEPGILTRSADVPRQEAIKRSGVLTRSGDVPDEATR